MNHPVFKLNDRLIGKEYPPLLVAEIGINHNGSLEQAKHLVDCAYKAGIEVIKHQTHIPEDEYSLEAADVKPAHTNESIVNIMRDCCLSESDEYELMNYVHEKGQVFISTPFSRKALERLISFNIPALKIGSGECSNYPLLELVGSHKIPVVMSTGMNDIKSISLAIKALNLDHDQLALLHTTNIYPTPFDHVRLSAMIDMNNNFPEYVFGLSDHTINSISSLGAVALGASIIERHFTDDKYRNGPDISCSMTMQDAFHLKHNIDIMHQCLGLGSEKRAHKNEKSTIEFAFASVVAYKDIQPGDLLSSENLWVKRPGTGEIKADNFKSLIGKTAVSFIPQNSQLKWSQIT